MLYVSYWDFFLYLGNEDNLESMLIVHNLGFSIIENFHI
jgi:hypothetical protein